MSSSDNAQTVCPAAAMADLRDLGVTFPGAALDCGSNECLPCTRRRANTGAAAANQETEAEKQDRLSQPIEDFVEITEVGTNSGRAGEEDESSVMIVDRDAENAFEKLCEDASARELASINELMWAAADRERPRLLREIDARRGLRWEEDCEMVDLNEAQIGLAEIENA